jgi:hypothetical protein
MFKKIPALGTSCIQSVNEGLNNNNPNKIGVLAVVTYHFPTSGWPELTELLNL